VIRIHEFKIEGMTEPVKVASMSYKMAKAFIARTKEMNANPDTPNEEWIDRRNATIIEAVNRAGANPVMTQEKLEDEFDGQMLSELYLFILEKSGLRSPGGVADVIAGESPAASTSTTSKAA
jgi:hypothetical protein